MNPLAPGPPFSVPTEWRDALLSIDHLARRARLPYAVVGSLGLAASLHLPWEATKRSPLDGSLVARDLDLFVMGTPEQRTRFCEVLKSEPGCRGLKIDVVRMYQAFTVFDAAGPALRYRRLRVPLNPKLFLPVSVPLGELAIPVLPVRVHMHLIGMQAGLSSKGKERVRTMARALARNLEVFSGPSEAECRVFHDYKRARAEQYPIRERIFYGRLVLADWETTSRKSRLVALKAHLREHHPRATALLRRLLD